MHEYPLVFRRCSLYLRHLMQTFRAVPRYLSETPDDTDVSVLHVGLGLLGKTAYPQQETIARVLEAKREGPVVKPQYRRVAVQVPRRSSKTWTIWAVILGRCATLKNHRVVVTGQDRTRAANIIREIMRELDALHPDTDSRPFTLRWSSGGEEILFKETRSRIWVVAPKAAAFRGESADTILFDEAGEISAEMSTDLVAGALPLMDTRPLGQIIIAGTPAPQRVGLFWDSLEAGRRGTSGIGIVDYSATEADDPTDEDLWWRVHPGLASGLTDIEIIRERFETMPLPTFCQEYLCMWSPDLTSRIIDAEKWMRLAGSVSALPSTKWALGFDCAPDGSSAAICAGWFDDDGLAHVQLLGHNQGTGWVAKELIKATKAHGRIPIAYDRIGDNITVVEEALRLRPRPAPKFEPMTMKDMAGAAAGFVQRAESETLRHAEQPGLDKAVEIATWRYSSDSRLFARRGKDVSPLVAASAALYLAGRQTPATRISAQVRT